MSPNDLSRSIRLEPFVPFRICLTDGTHYDVPHPEMIFLGVRTNMVFSTDRDGSNFADVPIKIDNLHITRIVRLSQVVQAA